MKQLFLLFCCVLSLSLFAQQPTVTYSETFDEPSAKTKVRLFRNAKGNTLLLQFTDRDGIYVNTFDEAHKPGGQAIITSELWDAGEMNRTSIAGIYDIGGDAVIFLEQTIKKQPLLYRLIISAETGKLIREDKIGEMPKYGAGAGYAMAFGGVQGKGFYIKKDQNSDAYAVLIFDGFAEETAKRIELIHYDGSHKEIGRSFYEGPDNKFKYINYLGMVTRGTDDVILCTYAYNTRASGGAESKLFVSTLKGQKFEHRILNITRDLKKTTARLVYNPKTSLIQIMTQSEVQKKSPMMSNTTITYFEVLLLAINANDYSVAYGKGLDPRLVTAYKKAHYDDQKDFTGLPTQIIANPDGTTTILMEVQVTGTYVNSEDIGILNYDAEGTPVSGYAFQRNNAGASELEYFNGSDASYLIYNDLQRNIEKGDGRKPKMVRGKGSGIQTICYRIHNNEVGRAYLFGEPGEEFDSRTAAYETGYYSEGAKEYVVMIHEQNRRDKSGRIAWVHF